MTELSIDNFQYPQASSEAAIILSRVGREEVVNVLLNTCPLLALVKKDSGVVHEPSTRKDTFAPP